MTDEEKIAAILPIIFGLLDSNHAPSISGTPGTSANVGGAYSFTPTASDMDAGDTLTFSITNKPTWATFDTTTGKLSGSPTAADASTTTSNIIISVTDNKSAPVSLPAFSISVGADTAVQDALASGSADAVTTEELLSAMSGVLNGFTTQCEAALNTLYPNGLVPKADVNIGMLQSLTDTTPGWIPWIVANNAGSPKVYAYVRELPNGTRVVASGIPLFSPSEMKANFNDGADKTAILNLLKWLAGSKGKDVNGQLKSDTDFLNSHLNITYHGGAADWGYGDWNGLFKLDQWIGGNFNPSTGVTFAASGLPANWTNTKTNASWNVVDLTKLADANQDIFMLGEATDEAIDTVLAHAANGSPKGLYVQYSPPTYNTKVNSRLGIKKSGAWFGDDQLAYGDSVSLASQCAIGSTPALIALVHSLETGLPDFNYEAGDCLNNIGTVSCDLNKVTDAAGNSVAQLFNDGASAIRSRLLEWDSSGIDVFSLGSEYDLFKLAVLAGDKYRANIQYPMDKIATDDTAFYQALFADFTVHYSREGNAYQPDMGDFTDAQAALNAATTKTAIRTYTPTVYGEWTSTGLYAPPGKVITVRRTDSSDSEVKFRFNLLRESTRLWNENKYSRPRYMSSPVVTLEKGQTYTFSTPYGGSVYLGWNGVESGATPFTVEVTGVLDNPLLDAFDAVSIQSFLNDVLLTDSDWVDIKTPYAEIHSLKSYVLKSFDSQDGTTGNGYTPEDVQAYIEDLNNYLIAGNYEYAGFTGTGLQPLNDEASGFCGEFSLNSVDYLEDGTLRELCTDAIIHAKPRIQHINADINAACGALCSGNPFDSYAPIDPLGWGENHEMGHNLQRGRLKIYDGRSTEVSNNIFPLHTQWRWTVDQGLDKHPTQTSPANQEAFTLLQNAIAANTPANINHPLWSGSGTYDNAFLRLSFYMQLAYTQQSWDLYTKLYLMERIYTDAIKSDTKWSAVKDLLGFGSYPRADSDGVSGNDATTLSGNDFMYIAASNIAGKNYSDFFEAWGIEVSQMAKDQVAALGITTQVPKLFYYVHDELPAVMPTMADTIPLDGTRTWTVPTTP
ncbi:ImpA family metalloprotease [Thiothrix nivea]|uniref:ImpA family metalloprotease n=1 Tax=Thiothrix nivea TaxID=1031 RepID=UPI0002DA3C90|nr:ImpA family metalloprotease [Thiothrix nivea]